MMTNSMSQFESAEEKNKYVLLALVGLGIGEIIGAFIFGYVQDNYSNKISSWFCLLLSTLGVAIGFAYALIYSFTLWFAALMLCFWGI